MIDQYYTVVAWKFLTLLVQETKNQSIVAGLVLHEQLEDRKIDQITLLKILSSTMNVLCSYHLWIVAWLNWLSDFKVARLVNSVFCCLRPALMRPSANSTFIGYSNRMGHFCPLRWQWKLGCYAGYHTGKDTRKKNALVMWWMHCALHQNWGHTHPTLLCWGSLPHYQWPLPRVEDPSALSSQVKNHLRSTMNETHLNGLAHLFINRDLKLNYDKVIDLFGGSHNHRMKFVWTVNSLIE